MEICWKALGMGGVNNGGRGRFKEAGGGHLDGSTRARRSLPGVKVCSKISTSRLRFEGDTCSISAVLIIMSSTLVLSCKCLLEFMIRA